MSDLISRQDVLHELDGCDYELKDWQRWKLKTMVRDIPSAEKTQLSQEDATFDCISRQAAITEFSCCELTPDGGIDVNYAIDFLEQLPSAEKTGKLLTNTYYTELWGASSICGVCGCSWQIDEDGDDNFCPNCGAMMVQEVEE